jgi:hypothetical protein
MAACEEGLSSMELILVRCQTINCSLVHSLSFEAREYVIFGLNRAGVSLFFFNYKYLYVHFPCYESSSQEFCLSFYSRMEEAGSGQYVSDLYSSAARFESRLGHRLYWPRCFHSSPQSLNENAGIVP